MSLALKLALGPLLAAQGVLTRRRMPRLPEAAGARSGQAGAAADPPLRLLIVGDSSAAGVGVATQKKALALPLAGLLARRCRARVHWQLLARSGLTTAQALHWLQQDAGPRADVAVVVTGVNDVVDQVPSRRAVAAREALANWLRNGQGVQHVVFAPLPPVHRFAGLPQPLRWVAGSDAARHNRALVEWAATRGDVSCVAMKMPLDAATLAADGFHPGAPAYRHCAEAIAQHIATQVWPLLDLESKP